jgi:hypothetical protein
MIELMKKVRLDSATQNMKRHVPVFNASKCQMKGIETRTKLMNDKALNTRFMVMIREK